MAVQEGTMDFSSFQDSKPAHQQLNLFDRAERAAFLWILMDCICSTAVFIASMILYMIC